MAKRRRDVCGLPESEPLWRAGLGFVVRDLPWTVEKLHVIWRSGVSAEHRHLKISGNICGGLPTRRYEKVESSAGPLKIRAPGVCRAGIYFPASEVFGEGRWSVRPATMNSPSP